MIKETKTKTTHTRILPEQKQKLKLLAVTNNKTMLELLTEILNEVL